MITCKAGVQQVLSNGFSVWVVYAIYVICLLRYVSIVCDLFLSANKFMVMKVLLAWYMHTILNVSH